MSYSDLKEQFADLNISYSETKEQNSHNGVNDTTNINKTTQQYGVRPHPAPEVRGVGPPRLTEEPAENNNMKLGLTPPHHAGHGVGGQASDGRHGCDLLSPAGASRRTCGRA